MTSDNPLTATKACEMHIWVDADACPGDLVITADVPLAAQVVGQGGQALDPRGTLYTEANVGERLAMRNLLDELRGGGHITGGLANFTPKDRQAFANQLDRWLTAAQNRDRRGPTS